MKRTAWRACILVCGLTAVALALANSRCKNSSPTPQTVEGLQPVEAAPVLVEAPLPAGVKAVWDLDKAFHEKTPTRERICLNGLWRWQPGDAADVAVPVAKWGHFKVPGYWPGKQQYLLEDCQTLHVHPGWKDVNLKSISAAWHQREFTVPADWSGRRITLSAEYLNSLAFVYVDGKKVGEMRYPAGELDLTGACRPGGKHELSILVIALSLEGIMLSHVDTKTAEYVGRRGLCGDVFLTGVPAAARITDVKMDTSVRKGEIAVEAGLESLAADTAYALRVKIRENGQAIHEFTSKPFMASDLKSGRATVAEKWRPEKLWDTHTPQNMLDAEVELAEAKGKLLDAFPPVRFGFREFWIDGKDFYLNGTRIYLSAAMFGNAQIGARTATYAGARETMKRLKSFGINFIYPQNYGCQPGSHVSFTEILRAADDAGMLVALSQPHFRWYLWNKSPEADKANGYARHAEFYVRAAQNHPAVVAYALSHNSAGYDEDMNPDRIDGLQDAREDAWSKNNAASALRAEAIVTGLDPSRIAYHHGSGNLGAMHTCNFYVNFVPIQEMSDWFEHWSTQGVKPVFLAEYAVPYHADWAMYRGWYQGARDFSSANVPWEFCLAEWNAQFLGDRAYRISDLEKHNLRWEARLIRAGKLWHRWDYAHQVDRAAFDEPQAIMARYIQDNWRAFRTWGLSVNSPWENSAYWKLRPGADRSRKEFPVDWENLQQPGFSPDYIEQSTGHMPVGFEASDWAPTAAAQGLYRNNLPLLAYIGGKPGAFTSKDHNFRPGEVIEKQLIIINNSRETLTADCEWAFGAAAPAKGGKKVSIKTGEQERIPLRFEMPAAPVKPMITATVRFSNGVTQEDSFAIDSLAPRADPATGAKIALFDPKGETSKLLAGMKIPFQNVDANADLAGYDVLIVGKEALTTDQPGPDVRRVRDGLKVIVFEQTAKVLEQRFGFRVAEYGLREVFQRVPDHPLLAGLTEENLHDWRGAATLSPPRLNYTLVPRRGPTVSWCGIDVPRAWRRGCRGNVASVLIEKPARGDFLPILDGGYSLQYTPLLEYREGKGMVLFCQLDVTGRTENDPAADILVRNALGHVSTWKATPRRPALYVGEAAGKQHLEAAGFFVRDYAKEKLTADSLLIVGPGGGQRLTGDAATLGAWLTAGGHLLALGLDDADVAFLPFKIEMKKAEHIAAYFEPQAMNSSFVGISPAEVHNRDPREFPLVAGDAAILGDGILAKAQGADVVFCQIVPWQFDRQKQPNTKRTFRRAACLVTRLAANLGAAGATPALDRFRIPVDAAKKEKRWLDSFYLDVPEEWDDPYRFFRW